jgi:hypothetical protein
VGKSDLHTEGVDIPPPQNPQQQPPQNPPQHPPQQPQHPPQQPQSSQPQHRPSFEKVDSSNPGKYTIGDRAQLPPFKGWYVRDVVFDEGCSGPGHLCLHLEPPPPPPTSPGPDAGACHAAAGGLGGVGGVGGVDAGAGAGGGGGVLPGCSARERAGDDTYPAGKGFTKLRSSEVLVLCLAVLEYLQLNVGLNVGFAALPIARLPRMAAFASFCSFVAAHCG